jgi:hypothetical protein
MEVSAFANGRSPCPANVNRDGLDEPLSKKRTENMDRLRTAMGNLWARRPLSSSSSAELWERGAKVERSGQSEESPLLARLIHSHACTPALSLSLSRRLIISDRQLFAFDGADNTPLPMKRTTLFRATRKRIVLTTSSASDS